MAAGTQQFASVVCRGTSQNVGYSEPIVTAPGPLSPMLVLASPRTKASQTAAAERQFTCALGWELALHKAGLLLHVIQSQLVLHRFEALMRAGQSHTDTG